MARVAAGVRSMAVILFNKWLLAYSGFPFPLALTMCVRSPPRLRFARSCVAHPLLRASHTHAERAAPAAIFRPAAERARRTALPRGVRSPH